MAETLRVCTSCGLSGTKKQIPYRGFYCKKCYQKHIHYPKHRDELIRKSLSWNKANREQKNRNNRKHRVSRADYYSNQTKQWLAKRPGYSKAKCREWYLRNKGTPAHSAWVRFHSAWNRALKRQATPRWLSREDRWFMRELYRQLPGGHHVDHIIPLGGKNVCGLHVWWNLQYLTAEENLLKSNKLVLDRTVLK